MHAELLEIWCCLQVVCIDQQHGESPTPLPDADFNYHSELSGEERPWRTDLKPLDIVQPEGPSFKVGQQIIAILAQVQLLKCSRQAVNRRYWTPCHFHWH